jgi:hypothetical protein
MADFAGNPYLGHCEGKVLASCTIFLFSLALYFLIYDFSRIFLPLHGVKINNVTPYIAEYHGYMDYHGHVRVKTVVLGMLLHLHPLASKVF